MTDFQAPVTLAAIDPAAQVAPVSPGQAAEDPDLSADEFYLLQVLTGFQAECSLETELERLIRP